MIVPHDILDPIGKEYTQRLGKCADNWTDSEIEEMMVKLPLQYHCLSPESLRRMFITRRKRGTEGYQVGGLRSRNKPKKFFVVHIWDCGSDEKMVGVFSSLDKVKKLVESGSIRLLYSDEDSDEDSNDEMDLEDYTLVVQEYVLDSMREVGSPIFYKFATKKWLHH